MVSPRDHIMPLWRNWQTHLTQNQAVHPVPVRVRPAAADYDVVYGDRIAARNYRTPL